MKQLIITIFLSFCLIVPMIANATDGVIEINQAKVNAAGGLPYVISQPGSYRLTSNLTQADANVTVIQINANDVTLDLNGFAIIGPNSCTWQISSTVCSASGTGVGVASNALLVTVKNGSLNGIGGDGIVLEGSLSRVENVRVAQCGGDGIDTKRLGAVDRSHVFNCQGTGVSGQDVTNTMAERNGVTGIYARTISHSSATQNGGAGLQGFSVSNSRAENNHGDGIDTNHAVANLVDGNSGDGILIYDGGTVVGNTILGSGGFGIDSNGSNVLFTQNVLDSNAGGSTGDQTGGGHLPKSLPANSNLCNGSAC